MERIDPRARTTSELSSKDIRNIARVSFLDADNPQTSVRFVRAMESVGKLDRELSEIEIKDLLSRLRALGYENALFYLKSYEPLDGLGLVVDEALLADPPDFVTARNAIQVLSEEEGAVAEAFVEDMSHQVHQMMQNRPVNKS